jgi:outer membrane protein OmpA-like peptidoglycan-associated protein
MGVTLKSAAVLVATATLLGGCATKGALRQAVTDQQAALQQERSERMAADESAKQDYTQKIAQLHTDLQAMRDEFGAKIAAVEDGIKFDVPVHFAFNSSDVRPEDTAVLDRFASVVSKYYGGTTVTVEGFADPAGSARYNKALSEKRADAVSDYLQQKQINASLKTVGYGETRQVVKGAEKDQPGAELNRRVVFVVETPASSAGVAALDH